MEKKKLLASLLGVGLALGMPLQSFAQAQAPAAQAAPPPAQKVTDEGVKAVREAQEIPASELAIPEDAASVLEKIIEKKGWIRGWDEKKQRFIAIGAANIPVRVTNPAGQKDLQGLRRFAAQEAVLRAKAQIIRFINQEMSAEQQLLIPGTDLNKALNKEIEELIEQVNRQKEIIADLRAKKNRAKAEELRGTTFGDRLHHLMIATIKKLDKEYTGKEKDQVLAKRYREAAQAYNKEYAKYQELIKNAKLKRKEIVEKRSNAVQSMAAMPLFGATAVMQTESWDKDGTYQVAVIVVWSNVLERAARAIVTGTPYNIKKSASSKSLPVREWLRKQNLASMVGPRQYVDNDGVRWFLGIAAESVNRKLHPGTRNHNKENARRFASGEALLSVTSDMFAMEAAKEILNVYDAGKDADGNADFSAASAASIREKLNAKAEKVKISGGQVLHTKTVRHPISGDELYVVVFGFNPNHVKSALEKWTQLYATKAEAERYQTVRRGMQSAADDAVRKAKNDPADFKKGYDAQSKRIKQEKESRKIKKQKSGGIVIRNDNKKPAAPAKNQQGVFSGDTDVQDDF